MWNGGYPSYLGRSHGRADVIIIRCADNSCREKSADAILDDRNELKKNKRQRTHKSLKG